MQTVSKMFGRMGYRSEFAPVIHEALKLGAVLNEDTSAGTLTVTWDGNTLIRAVQNGSGEAPWIVMYNKEFYAQ